MAEAGFGIALRADIDERNKQQVAERQRMAVGRICREPAVQAEHKVEWRKQQDGKPERSGERERARKSQR